jgi:PhnB protein
LSQTTPWIDVFAQRRSLKVTIALFRKSIREMTHINAYLNFNGQCREAMTFYQHCLGGELVMQKIAESPMAARMPSEMGAKILHSSLTKNDLVLMASDMMGANVKSGNSISLCVNCSSDEEVNSFFNKLSKGGNILEPLHQSFWGATFGSLTDKFGITWIFNYSKN